MFQIEKPNALVKTVLSYGLKGIVAPVNGVDASRCLVLDSGIHPDWSVCQVGNSPLWQGSVQPESSPQVGAFHFPGSEVA